MMLRPRAAENVPMQDWTNGIPPSDCYAIVTAFLQTYSRANAAFTHYARIKQSLPPIRLRLSLDYK